MTNNHVIPKEELIIGNKIKLSYKNSLKYIEITGNRFFKTSALLDYTCIEILDEDQIEYFYEIEPCFYEKSDYINDEIAIVQYPKGGILKVKAGHLLSIDKYNITHNVSTFKGSSGSPILLLLRDYKVIGIHKAYNESKKINMGTFINNIIEHINLNEVLIEFTIKEENLGNPIIIIQDKLRNIKKDLFEFYINEKKIDNILSPYYFVESKNTLKIILKGKDTSFYKELFQQNEYLSITSLNLSHFNTNNVKDTSYMFQGLNKNCNIITDDQSLKQFIFNLE
jgi:hypothetical protein